MTLRTVVVAVLLLAVTAADVGAQKPPPRSRGSSEPSSGSKRESGVDRTGGGARVRSNTEATTHGDGDAQGLRARPNEGQPPGANQPAAASNQKGAGSKGKAESTTGAKPANEPGTRARSGGSEGSGARVARPAELQETVEALRTSTGAVEPAAQAKLMAALPEVRAGTAAEVNKLAADVLGVARESVVSKLIGAEPGAVGQRGATGARVYLILEKLPDGKERPISAVKIFPRTAEQRREFAGELSALDRLNKLPAIKGQGVVSAQAAAKTAQGHGVLFMSAAPGRSLDAMLLSLGRGEISLDPVLTAFRRNGEALARLHLATSRSDKPSSPALEAMTRDLKTKFAEIQKLVATSKDPQVVRLAADLRAAPPQVQPLIDGVMKNPGASAIVHGDFHPGNVFYDQTSDRITLIDAARVHDSIDQAGQGILSPARDVASGAASIEVFASNPEYHVAPAQRAQIKAAFRDGYDKTAAQGVFSQEALAFHQARYAASRLRDSLVGEPGSDHALRLEGAIHEFRAAFGVRPTGEPPGTAPR
jgi:Ser/Thr protein kinase RdoA (MazF antagonist)